MLDTDASEEAIGAELSQVQEGQERVKLTPELAGLISQSQRRGICFWPAQQISTTLQTAVSSGWTRKGPLDRDREGGEKWRILVGLDIRVRVRVRIECTKVFLMVWDNVGGQGFCQG